MAQLPHLNPAKLQNGFRRFLSKLSLPYRLSLFSQQGLTRAEGKWGRHALVLSRAMIRHTYFDLAAIPRPRRGAALLLMIRQWSPFPVYGHLVSWGNEGAMVWCWDAAALASSNTEPDAAVLPETIMRPASETDGVRLITCIDGVEAQHWQSGELRHSRWWAAQPSPAEWQAFQRACGSRADGVVPAQQNIPFQDKPWGHIWEGTAARAVSIDGWILAILILGLGSFTSQVLIERWRTNQSIAALQTKLADANKTSLPIIRARNEAERSLAELAMLRQLNPYPSQLSLMAQVSGELADDGTYLQDWSWADERLKIVINSPNTNIVTARYLEALESLESFEDIKSIPSVSPKLMEVNMRIKPFKDVETKAKDERRTN
ncbi:hypothetical protein [Chitinimonas naiadis]